MKVLSVNVGLPRPIRLGGCDTSTGIFKVPVAGPVAVRRHNLAGDAQADLQVHGGEFKAVYAYPFEHYAYWETALGRNDLAPGAFGENLTVTGVLEEDTRIGDVFRIGSATLQVTQPRIPCSKLAHKFSRPQIIREFLKSGRSGFYLRVLEEGQLQAGDEIVRIHLDPNRVSVRQLLGMAELGEYDKDAAARALRIDSLPPNWKEQVAESMALAEIDPRSRP